MPAAEEDGRGPLVALVLVSHSAKVAEGAAELAAAMAADVTISPAGGMAPPEQALGTDASRIAEAIEGSWSERGVLVLMDLGSAILSAELALEMVPDERRSAVRLSSAPLVEGAVAAAVAAQAGLSLAEVAAAAAEGLSGKTDQLGEEAASPSPPDRPSQDGEGWAQVEVAVDLPLGLHARPAARLVTDTSRFDAEVLASNASSGRGPVSARSLNALATLQVGSGQRLRVQARGPQAEQVIAAVEELAAQRFGEPLSAPPAPPAERPAGSLQDLPEGTMAGLPASPGTAYGPLVLLGHPRLDIPDAPPGEPSVELEILGRALAITRQELVELRTATARRAGPYEAAIIDAHLLFLDDPELLEPARRAIEAGGTGAAQAWAAAVAAARKGWEGMSDPTMRLRAADLDGVARKVLAHLLGVPEAAPEGTGVLVAEELSPTVAAGLSSDQVLGIATSGGGPTSHAAILARSLGIPAVVGLGPQLLRLRSGTPVLLDGDRGTLTEGAVAPASLGTPLGTLPRRRAEPGADRRPAVTRDGVPIEVAANVGSLADVEAAARAGADGVGLLRTEFLFQTAEEMPSELQQVQAYEAMATALGGRPLTIRTLDVGADKPLPYLPQGREDNPAMGVRGLRLGLARPELLRAQLGAVVEVARRHPVRVMFPMVASADEVRAALALLDQAMAERSGGEATGMELGVMIEIPAAALAASSLAGLVGFMSIGTNDLSQYTLAADRGNPGVAGLADALHPAVLRLIQATCAAGEAAHAWVGVCGELAGESSATALLVGLGVRELSVAPRRVAEVKRAVRRTELAAARSLAAQALDLDGPQAVRRLLARSRRS